MATRASEDAQTEVVGTPRVLAIKLDIGDEVEIDAGNEIEAARERLASFFGDVDTHKFVRFDDDTLVRSSQIAYMQLRERRDDQQSAGVIDAVKSKIGGGSDMSTYGDEETGGTTRRVSVPRTSGGYGQGYGSRPQRPQPLFDMNRGSETKPFFLTSEFLTTAGIIAALAIAMAQLDNFNADRGWLLITAIAAAYVLSRGIAKAATRSHSEDPRERLGWGDDDR